MTFDSDKFIQANIMELIDQGNPKNLKFTAEFELAVENKLSEIDNIEEAFRIVALAFAMKENVDLADLEINYATDLYLGINPWNKK
jgi:hypothetical protein